MVSRLRAEQRYNCEILFQKWKNANATRFGLAYYRLSRLYSKSSALQYGMALLLK